MLGGQIYSRSGGRVDVFTSCFYLSIWSKEIVFNVHKN